MNVDFYINGFGAVELRPFSNDDGSVHVSELSIEGAVFHLHQENQLKRALTPEQAAGVTSIVGLFVPDVDAFITRAVEAGAELISPAQDFEYGLRQGQGRDIFGHVWLIEKTIELN
jgi:PhnB protein